MNHKEKQLAAKMLEIASDSFSSHVCNDVEDSVYEGWTLEERQEFVKSFHEWNGDPEEYSPNFLHLGDSAIMAYLAHKLNQNQKPMSKKKTRHSAKDGKFVSKEFAKANPDEVVEVTNHDHKTELEKFRSWIIANGKDINSESVVSEYLTEK